LEYLRFGEINLDRIKFVSKILNKEPKMYSGLIGNKRKFTVGGALRVITKKIRNSFYYYCYVGIG
jgi:hypothetical protein